jgi:peptide/nickel transport system permease protein
MHPALQTFLRFGKFSINRAISLFIVMAISIFLTILIASRSVVIESDLKNPGDNPSPVGGWFSGVANPVISYKPHSREQTSPLISATRLMVQGITFNLGEARGWYHIGQKAYHKVDELILLTLPRTLLLFGTANLLVFITSITVALAMINRYGGWLEKFILTFSPLSTIPAWIYGLLITVFMARVLKIWMGGMLTTWPDEFTWDYVLRILKHASPAIIAIFLSKFFLSVYTWRSYLLIYSGEDYLELAKAKGLTKGMIDRRYLLRPALPNILTIFTVMMIAIWQEAIIIELFFSVMGIGQLFYLAIRGMDIPLIMCVTVLFGYLLAISVFILDILHGILDPRVSLASKDPAGGGTKSGKVVQQVKRPFWKRAPKPVFIDWEPSLKAGYPEKKFNFDRLVSRDFPNAWSNFWRRISHDLPRLKELIVQLRRFPTAVAGAVVIICLISISIAAPSIMPYQDAIFRWNYDASLSQLNPARAFPAWFNLLRQDKLPESIFIDSRSSPEIKTVSKIGEDMTEILFVYEIDFPYHNFPQEISLYIAPKFEEKLPYVSLEWHTPDGRQIDFGAFQASKTERYFFRNNSRLMRQIGGENPHVGLFADPDDKSRAFPGKYELIVSAIVFEENGDFEAELQIFGQVYGLAGTDHRRRDLSIALLWGTPIALAFGMIGAVGTTFTTMVVAATSAYFEGWVDTLIQRLTEITKILPVFPILLIIYNFHWKSVWAILGVAVLLGIFGGAIKTYRTIFLSVKGAPYMEAARCYGTGNVRMISRYLIPRILPVLIPQLIILVPTYVYLEATLAFLNMSDPTAPTWGKLIRDAVMHGGLDGAYHWILLPAGVLLLTGIAFLMVGYAFEKVLNPRLRER